MPNVVSGGFVRDSDGRVVVSGGGSGIATLAVPRYVYSAGGGATTSAVAGTEYLLAGATELAANLSITNAFMRQLPRFVYNGANYDYGGVTQKLYMDCGVLVGTTAPGGTITFSLCPFTVVGDLWVKGTSVLTSSAMNLAASSQFINSTTTTINKPSNGTYMVTYLLSSIPLGAMNLDVRLYVQNV